MVYTTSYGKDAYGREPVKVVDLVPTNTWEQTTYPIDGYGKVLGTMKDNPNPNFFWLIHGQRYAYFKGGNYSLTGRRKYKVK